MAAIIFQEVVETNLVTFVAMDDQPMNFIVRINGNIHPIQQALAQLNREAARVKRGSITA